MSNGFEPLGGVPFWQRTRTHVTAALVAAVILRALDNHFSRGVHNRNIFLPVLASLFLFVLLRTLIQLPSKRRELEELAKSRLDEAKASMERAATLAAEGRVRERLASHDREIERLKAFADENAGAPTWDEFRQWKGRVECLRDDLGVPQIVRTPTHFVVAARKDGKAQIYFLGIDGPRGRIHDGLRVRAGSSDGFFVDIPTALRDEPGYKEQSFQGPVKVGDWFLWPTRKGSEAMRLVDMVDDLAAGRNPLRIKVTELFVAPAAATESPSVTVPVPPA